MKSPKERQDAYRQRRKEHKNAGLTKLKILASATTGRRLEILSEIDNTDVSNVLGQAVELLWTQRFGNAEIASESEAKPDKEKPAKPAKAAKPAKPAKPDKAKPAKPAKPAKEKAAKEKAAKPAKPKTKSGKSEGKTEPGNPVVAT
jgi:outer membrane biosynthesis protein TonB